MSWLAPLASAKDAEAPTPEADSQGSDAEPPQPEQPQPEQPQPEQPQTEQPQADPSVEETSPATDGGQASFPEPTAPLAAEPEPLTPPSTPAQRPAFPVARPDAPDEPSGSSPATSQQPTPQNSPTADSAPARPLRAEDSGTDVHAAKKDPFDGGLYFDLNFGVALGLASTHEWNETCPTVTEIDWTPTCKTHKPIGGLIGGNFGFRFGVVGVEAFGLFSGDYSSARLEGDQPAISLPSYATNMQVGRLGGALGGGLRVMNTGPVRVSAAVGGGVIFRHVFTNVSSLDGSSEGYQSPLIRADLALTLGKFFNLGVMGWVEFSREIEVTPRLDSASSLIGSDPRVDAALSAIEEGLGDVRVFRGPQYFVTPYVGFHFGK